MYSLILKDSEASKKAWQTRGKGTPTHSVVEVPGEGFAVVSSHTKVTEGGKEITETGGKVGKYHPTKEAAQSSATALNKKAQTTAISAGLSELSKGYHKDLPLKQALSLAEQNGHDPVQEDGTAWSGILTGRDGRATIPLKNRSSGKIDNGIAMQWHKMDSGKWEFNAYLTGSSKFDQSSSAKSSLAMSLGL